MIPSLSRLQIERQTHPLAIDTHRPRFSWLAPELRPRAVRVVVVSADGVLIWDSGRRAGDLGWVRPETDLPLASLSDYTWRVEVEALIDGAPREISASASFGTGALDPGAWAGSDWISGDPARTAAAPLLRICFDLPAPATRARLLLTAGGYAAATLDERPVSDEVLSPGLTAYATRVPYVVHDVGDRLGPGAHVLAIALGRGFYGMTTENTWNWHRAPWHAEPCVRAVLVIEHGNGATRVVTDASARTSRGGTLSDSLYEGEVFDQRREPDGWRGVDFDDGEWDAATIVPGPRGILRARPFPGIRVVESLTPVSVEQRGARVIADFGRQIAGWVRVSPPARTPAGSEIVVTHTERLIDGTPTISTPFSAGDLQVDRVTTDGGGLSWEPSFGYKGFQYVAIDGWPGPLAPGDVVARVAHSDLARRARFTCSDELLTWMHEATVATMLNNLHHIPTDTPVFEKNGWTGDAQLAADMMLRDLDSVGLLEDWCRSVSESRDHDGRPALIAPTPGWIWPDHMAAPPWHSAYVLVPWRIYLATGDTSVLHEHFEGIVAYVRLEHETASSGLSQTGLGDYLSPDKSGNPDEDLRVCATVAVYECTEVVAAMARILERPDIVREMAGRAEVIRGAFLREFFDRDAGVVRDGVAGYRQTHNILALAAGLIPTLEQSRVARALATDVTDHRRGHLWTGALGTRRALQTLDAHGHERAAFQAATARDFPSWGWWHDQGATTMWEYWDDQRSRNHYFFGTVDDWLFSNVAGIALSEPGYRRVTVQPRHLERVAESSAHIDTVRGDVMVAWEGDEGGGAFTVTLPQGCIADIRLPGIRDTMEGGSAEFRVRLPGGAAQ